MCSLQIFSDIFNAPVVVFEGSDVLPSIALSSVVLYAKGIISSYSDFIGDILRKQKSVVFYPDKENVEHYRKLYERFKKIYPAVKGLF